ncbi:hypothetical protein [Halomicrococcus gelatinilyticus]|uniref:hypothetical protein n=1 Tax=Halomicrococcus gelatinilyticus TaxID=1702103 RepID=UPI002E0D9E14
MTGRAVQAGTLRRLRQQLGPWINRAVEAVGEPTTRVYPAGYVGTVPLSFDDLAAELDDSPFTWDPLSMYHYTKEGNDTDGSWAYRSSLLGDRQLHVVLFATGSESTEVYAHDEFNWLRHPVEHAREVDIRRHEGSAEMRRWLDDRGIEYERDSRPLRAVKHTARQIRDRIVAVATESDASRGLPRQLR